MSPVRNAAAVLDALRHACNSHPNERVMQVIVNALGTGDPFHIEDDRAARALEAYTQAASQ